DRPARADGRGDCRGGGSGAVPAVRPEIPDRLRQYGRRSRSKLQRAARDGGDGADDAELISAFLCAAWNRLPVRPLVRRPEEGQCRSSTQSFPARELITHGQKSYSWAIAVSLYPSVFPIPFPPAAPSAG